MRSTRGARLRSLAAACGCAAALALSSPGPLRAQTPPSGHRIAPGPLEIHVVDQETQKPVRGAVVHVGGRYATTGLKGVGVLDGLPAGVYRVRIEEPGYERLAMRTSVPPGRRAPLLFSLVPVKTGAIAGTVVFSEIALPVSGATVHLEPVAVGAASQGPIDCTTGFDGTFRAVDVPPGIYRVRIGAPGAHLLDVEVELGGFPKEAALRFELDRTWREAALDVHVTDARTGQPLPAATVELAEAWPLGAIAQVTTGGGGVASLRGLRVGRQNAAGPKGRVSISAGRVTCRVSLEGYAPALRTLSLGPRARLFVSLSPTGEREATPQSLVAATPQPIPFDTPVRLTLARVGQRRRFRLRLKEPAALRIEVASPKLDTYVRLIGTSGDSAAAHGAYRGAAPHVVRAEVRAGTYTLEISEWGDNQASPEPLLLTVRRKTAPDAHEPNDELTQETPVVGGQVVRGAIFPRGDVDAFRLELDRPASVRLVSPPHALDRHVQILDEQGRAVAGRGAYASDPLVLVCGLPAGVYRIALSEWGSNAASPDPAELRIQTSPADDVPEPKPERGRLRAARSLAPTDRVGATINPVGDVDRYLVPLPSAGRLRVGVRGPIDLYLRVRSSDGAVKDGRGCYAGSVARVAWQVPGPATAIIEVEEWGNNASSPGSYRFETHLERGDPEETDRSDADPPRVLPLGEARGFRVGRRKDRDRFIVSTVAAGPHTLRVRAPLDVYVRVFDDRTGALVAGRGSYANHALTIALAPSGPTRYRIEVEEWGQNAWSAAPCALLLVPGKTAPPIPAAQLSVEHDPTDPTAVRFVARPPTGQGVVAAARLELDPDGDGRPDLTLAPGAQARWRFRSEGVFPVGMRAIGPGGLVATDHLWVAAIGPRERKGVWVLVSHPRPGEVVADARPAEIRAMGYTGAPIARVEAWLGGRRLGATHRRPFDLDIPWLAIGAGERTIRFVALDTRGERGELKRTVRLSPYFDLRPPDGASVSGDRVRVAWRASGFQPARVRLRKRGTEAWIEVVGESSRRPVVQLEGLEPGQAYEWQPLGAGKPGPVRTVTRVKGLAFGRARYGGSIARDYDQKLGITVRNHGEKAATVRLVCGAPEDGSRLLVGFVGEGSEGAPFELASGEERSFLLGLSAQDVIREVHRFPIRLAGAGGLTDEPARSRSRAGTCAGGTTSSAAIFPCPCS